MSAWVVLRDPSKHYSFVLPYWTGLSADKGKQGEGSCTVSLPLEAGAGVPAEFFQQLGQVGWSLDVYFWKNVPGGLEKALVPSWSGPITGATRRRDRDRVAWMDIRAETWPLHLLRRRLSISTYHQPWVDYSGGTYWSALVYTILAASITATAPYSGRQNSYPSTRSDYKWWQVLSGSTTNVGPYGYIPSIESGGSVWDHVYSLCETASLALRLNETRAYNAGWGANIPTFKFEVEYPYTRNDLSGTHVLSDLTGALVGFEDNTDWSQLANVYVQRGKGQDTYNDPQYAQMSANDQSVENYGVFEDGDTSWGDASTASLSSKAVLEAAKRGIPQTTYSVAIDKPPFALALGETFDVRDKITVHDSVLLPDGAEQTIVGWSASCSDPGAEPSIELTIGDTPENWERRIWDYVGGAGGRTWGGPGRRKGG